MVSANNTAIIATATNVADPRSSRFDGGHRLGCDGDARQERRARCDGGDHQRAVTPQPYSCSVGRNTLRRNRSRTVVATACEAGSLTCGINATDLHGDRGEPRYAQDEHDDQGSDREGRFDSDTAGVID
jgi:hypothetical protein